ncbi:hypothetical protein AB7M37_005083 [Sinorhizobium fredii]
MRSTQSATCAIRLVPLAGTAPRTSDRPARNEQARGLSAGKAGSLVDAADVIGTLKIMLAGKDRKAFTLPMFF